MPIHHFIVAGHACRLALETPTLCGAVRVIRFKGFVSNARRIPCIRQAWPKLRTSQCESRPVAKLATVTDSSALLSGLQGPDVSAGFQTTCLRPCPAGANQPDCGSRGAHQDWLRGRPIGRLPSIDTEVRPQSSKPSTDGTSRIGRSPVAIGCCKVCGSAPALGSWNLADAALMQCKAPDKRPSQGR